MIALNLYGTRRDLLPYTMRQRGGTDSEIELLSLEESQALEKVSLQRFAHLPGDVLDWRQVPTVDRFLYDDESDAVTILSRIIAERSSKASSAVIFWGSLAIPTVKMPVNAVPKHLASIIEVGPQYFCRVKGT